MKGKKLVKKLLLFLMVFSVTAAAEVVMEKQSVYGYDDYVWNATRGNSDEEAMECMALVDYGYLTHEDLYNQCCKNWYSVEVIEDMLNKGYMLDYEQQLKDAGWIPNDFVRTPVSTSTSSTSGNNTQATTPSKPSYTQEEIDAAWVENKRVEATCISDGYIEYKNSLTDETKTEVLSVLSHEYGETARVEATCEEDGSITYTCVLCNEESYTEAIVASGHQSGAWIVAKEPTLFGEGLKEQRCTVDNVVLATEIIPQTCPLPLSVVIGLGTIVMAMIVGICIYKKKK